ncbi:MAG: hypothetical protein ABL888_08085 [Pirellulaceae bacterium]
MAQFSIRAILLICVYSAICCLVYLVPSLWVGWMVVIATAIWMSIAMVAAFQSRDRFKLGFAVTGSVWLIIWFGFAVETSRPIAVFDIREFISKIMTGGKSVPEIDPTLPTTTYARLHDLYTSVDIAGVGSKRHIPLWFNSIRLFVCLSALVVGCLGGIIFQLCGQRRESV